MISKIKNINRILLISVLTIPILYYNFLIVKVNIINENSFQDEETVCTSFIHSINGKNYFAEYITSETKEELKEKIIDRDPNKDYNKIINGHGTGLSDPIEEDLEQLIGNINIKKIILDDSPRAPTSCDLSTEMYFPTVGSQGSQGSCAAWASVYYAYGYMEARDNGWDASSGNPKYLMSPAWTFNKVSLGGGSNMAANYQILLDFGGATMDTMPYNASDANGWGSESAWREAPKHKALNQYGIAFDNANPDTTIELIKDLISSGSPIVFAIDAGEYSSGFSDNNYILSAAEYSSESVNHANCFIGYDDSIEDDGDNGAFKVVNSWGKNWGDAGFYWLTYDAFIEMKMGSGNCARVIEDREDYMPSLIATWRFDNAPLRMDDIVTLGIGSYDTPLDRFTPSYKNDENQALPEFMALDITEFHSQLITNNDLNFFLQVDSSSITGTITSFKVERHKSGSLLQVTEESPDIPGSLPGHVNNHFKILISSPVLIPEIPIIPLIIGIAAFSAFGIVVAKRHVSKSKSPVQSKIPVKGSSNKLAGSKHTNKKFENPSKQGIQKTKPNIVINQHYTNTRNQRINPQQARIQHSKYPNSRNKLTGNQKIHPQKTPIQQSRYQISRINQAGSQKIYPQKAPVQQSRYQTSRINQAGSQRSYPQKAPVQQSRYQTSRIKQASSQRIYPQQTRIQQSRYQNLEDNKKKNKNR